MSILSQVLREGVFAYLFVLSVYLAGESSQTWYCELCAECIHIWVRGGKGEWSTQKYQLLQK